MRIRYQGEVAWLDAQLADLWSDLDAQGLLDDTLVVFWIDHGEQFFERGHQTHAWTLYGEETDSTAFFWAEDIQPMAWAGPTMAVDIVPTVLNTFGLEAPDSVSGLVVGEAPDDRARFSTSAAKLGVVQSVRQGPHRLHFAWGDLSDSDEVGDGQGVHVYDVVADPGETNDLFDPTDPTVQDLWTLLLPRIEANAAAMPERTISWPDGLATP
jgi:arylsulfatase A-like enzyme